MPLLSISQISKSFHNRALFDRIAFSVEEGDRIALIGGNGAGKTTLFHIVEGKVAPDEGTVIRHGRVIIGYLSQSMEDDDNGNSPLKSREILDLEERILRLETQLSHANPEETSSLLSEYGRATAEYEAKGGYDFEQRMLEVLSGLGLTSEDLARPVTSLSGGERMRVALARLIVQRPDLLLLDEPTNHLDTGAMEWLEDYLKKYPGAVMLISHDRYFIDRTSTRILELENATIKEYRGNYSDYVRQKDQFIRDSRQAIAQLEREVARQAEVTQTLLSHRKMTSYHAREKVVAKLSDKLKAEKSKLSGGPMRMNFTFVPEKREGDPDRILLRTKGLSKSYSDTPLFSDLALEIKASDKYVLCGPNGCGKTTLLSVLLGQITDFEGDVIISSTAEFGYMGQFVPFEDESRELIDELLSRAELTETEGRNLLARFGFRDIDVFKKISVLSGGERSRLYLCCLLQESPDVLFLDEPTNHLDIPSREILENALADYTGAILAVSHDRYFIEKCAAKIYGFISGTVRTYSNYAEYRFAAKSAESVSPRTSAERTPSEKKIPVKATAQESTESKGINRAKERQKAAQKKERVRAIERQIEEQEQEKIRLELSFSKDTPPETYAEYAQLDIDLAALYDELIRLSEDE